MRMPAWKCWEPKFQYQFKIDLMPGNHDQPKLVFDWWQEAAKLEARAILREAGVTGWVVLHVKEEEP